MRVPRIPLALLALSGVLVGGCLDKEPSPAPQSPATKPGRSIATSTLGKDRAATLAALALPQAYLADKLGAHELKATSLPRPKICSLPLPARRLITWVPGRRLSTS